MRSGVAVEPVLESMATDIARASVLLAHRALVDARACARCHFELRRCGVMA